MAAPTSMTNVFRTDASIAEPFDAGPYTRVQQRLRLMRPGVLALGRRAALLAAIAWLPLLLLAAAQGLAIGPTPRESLLLDIGAYARYLIALPLFVIAEGTCLPRLSQITRHFVTAGLVRDEDRGRIAELIASSRRLLEHRGAELVLVIIAYALAIGVPEFIYPRGISSWVAPIRNGEAAMSWAGWWRMLVSQPLYLLFLGIWLWRLTCWTRLLWRISRLDLQLVPAHPDRMGGLHFVSYALPTFALVVIAIDVAFAGGIAEGILVDGRPPRQYYVLVATIVVGVLAIVAGPLFVFAGTLWRARQRGIFEYEGLAGALGRRFERRWLGSGKPPDDDALAAPDFSATTDLYSIVRNVTEIRLLPFDLRSLAPLVGAAVLPFLPLVLIILPFGELLTLLARLVL